MMRTIDVANWEAFEKKVNTIGAGKASGSASPVLFRGLSDSQWPLSTTLERHGHLDMPFLDYYAAIKRVKSQIETYTSTRTWEVETNEVMNELAGDYDSMSRYLKSDDFKAYGYMAFLRHRGFPSPFLDWTRSRYVAGFFAFRSPVRPQSGHVAIFVYFQRPHAPKLGAIGDPEIFQLGPYVRTDRRHFLQQGQYTMCLHFSSTCLFRHHEFAFQDENQKQDTLWKLTIPWDERLKVLRLLDSHNLNALSLLESDEALLETLAFRELGTLPKSSRL